MNLAHVCKLINFEWRHPVLNLHVLGTITVDAARRTASITIHRVMDTEHGLGNVTREIMLNTLVNYWIKYYGKPDIVRTDPEGASRDQGFRRGLAAKSIRHLLIVGMRPGKQECLEKHWIQSNRQQYVWLKEHLTVSQVKKSLMSALLLTTTCIEIEDSLSGRFCWERHCQTSRFVKILIWLNAVSKLWTKLQSSASE